MVALIVLVATDGLCGPGGTDGPGSSGGPSGVFLKRVFSGRLLSESVFLVSVFCCPNVYSLPKLCEFI